MAPSAASAGDAGATLDGDADAKGPLSSLNLGFLRSLQDKRTTREGNPPKRRGPKPDSRPALTRRQELNRQAQRTHRERKELYVKALEDEVLRLKEVFSSVSQDKDRLAEENLRLKALLAGQPPPPQQQHARSQSSGGAHGPLDDSISNPASATTGSTATATGHGYGHAHGGGGGGGGTSVSGGGSSSHTSAFTPAAATAGSLGSSGRGPGYGHQQQMGAGGQQQRNPAVDYEQAGIAFVLTLEKPCMVHLPWLLERGAAAGGAVPCGHALMASCPPDRFSELAPDTPFCCTYVPALREGKADPLDPAAAPLPPPPPGAPAVCGANYQEQQRTWEVSKGSLAKLLDLSRRLSLDGEITPVMAWGMVLAHPRLGELTPADFRRLTEELGGKIRCYGFGAVLEEFEVRDALESVFSTKQEPLCCPAAMS